MRKMLLLALISCTTSFDNHATAQCNPSLWNWVYHSYRLVVHDSCTFATGTVEASYGEADGDYHIRLNVDSPYKYMLNSVNYSSEYGDLVCEPICVTSITQTDAIAPCAPLVDSIAHNIDTVYLPNVGEYVKITGPYVTDNDHGWNEIHPVTSITIFSPTGISPVATNDDVQIEVYPNPAPSFVNFKMKDVPSAPVFITILDDVGRLAGRYQMWQTLNLRVRTVNLPTGTYHYHIEQPNRYISGGSFDVIR